MPRRHNQPVLVPHPFVAAIVPPRPNGDFPGDGGRIMDNLPTYKFQPTHMSELPTCAVCGRLRNDDLHVSAEHEESKAWG